MKAATNIFSLQHNVQQWIFLSKTKTITRDSHYGIDGWILNIMTEKNKVAPSRNYVSCVFNKYLGIDKFWSEFLFLSEMTFTEKKIYKKETKLPFPLLIDKASEKKAQLHVKDKDGKELYKSDSFFKKQAKELYTSNTEFKEWFDYAVNLSCYERITNGMFKLPDKEKETEVEFVPDEMDIELEQKLNKKDETEAEELQTLPDIPEDLNNISEQKVEYFDNTDVEMPPTTHPRDNMPLEEKEPRQESESELELDQYQSTF